MKLGLDTNVLVCAHVAALPDHGVVRQFLLRQLGKRGQTLVLTPSVLHEFVHVVTDPRRFDPPVVMGEALALARLYLGRSNVDCVATDAEALADALALVERHGLGGKRLADTLLAATLLRHGVTRLATCKPGDFEPFSSLRLVDPRDPGASRGEP